MSDDAIRILTGEDVLALFDGRELEIMNAVEHAYRLHALGDSFLPASTFLGFPGRPDNRIIALPAYLGGDVDAAGIKWISSYPANRERSLERASAVIILNDNLTGRPTLMAEGSVISAKRTAASAALAATRLGDGGTTLGIVGCGPINFEIVRFIVAALPGIDRIDLHDLRPDAVASFAGKLHAIRKDLRVERAASIGEVLARNTLISFATTALEPHVDVLPAVAPGTVILHVSLRDLSPSILLASRNIVDDVDHVCRARTSAHLAEQLVGHRDFIDGTLGELLLGRIGGASDAVTVFSPFGLGVLDLALAVEAERLARDNGAGAIVPSFFPEHWLRR